MDEKFQYAINFVKNQVKKYGEDKLAIVSSFGKDSIVVQDIVEQVVGKMQILWIKPPFLPPDTLIYVKEYIEKNDLDVIELRHELNAVQMGQVRRDQLWLTNPEGCCQMFKVKPILDYIRKSNLKGWFSGMRKTESQKRGMYTFEWKQGDFVKLHPILEFTEADVWRYIATHGLKPHPWYKKGYRSLGCDVCSFPNAWGSEREGRWKNTMMEGGDCGIHCTPMK